MSRKRNATPPRGGRPRGPATPDGARPPARRGGPPWLALLAVAALMAAGVWGWRTFGRGGEAAIEMTPEQARVAGARLLEQQRAEEALPWLRRGIEGSGASQWNAHYVLARACAAASLATTTRAGIEQPLLRSSVERVAVARECARAFDTAAALAAPGADRAFVLAEWAEFEFAWGRMFEAFALFRRAQAETPGNAALVQRADAFQHMLEHPEVFETTEETMRRERGR